MSLTELLVHVEELSRADKICLMKTLLDGLAEENTKLAEANGLWEIRNSPATAYALQQMLDEQRAQEAVEKLIPPGEYAIWSPYDAYEAADIMKKVLEQEKQ